MNPSYRRMGSQVLVRRVSRPTRASLDYAAYHANFMNADPPPDGAMIGDKGKRPTTTNPFGGVLVAGSLTGSVANTALSADERAHPLALAPLVELLVSKKVTGADRLEDVVARVRSVSWGLAGGPQIVRQMATEAFLHDPGSGRAVEIWIKIEFAPWFTGFSSSPDEDGDGFPEIYGRVADSALGPARDIVKFIRTEYEGRVFTPAEVKAWAHQLASYWYPSYNTDLVTTPAAWPADDTESAIRKELGSLSFSAPTVVMRGKPLGKPVYNVFLVEGTVESPGPVAQKSGAAGQGTTQSQIPAAGLSLGPSTPSPNTATVKKVILAELAAHGKSWSSWTAEVSAFRATLKQRFDSMPAGSKALAGSDGFLFFRNSVAYVLGGDLARQSGDRNPIPAIVAWKKLLAKHGVDFLFIPIPTKEEIFPEKIGATSGDAALAPFAGKVVNPFGRKFLLDLADKGVETVDLLPAFLAGRSVRASEPLYQAQDTHWTARGLELAAKIVAERITHYPWYKGI
ncbi:MAG: hypothetical protein WCG85_20940, partial [Polyangia bacterium]